MHWPALGSTAATNESRTLASWSVPVEMVSNTGLKASVNSALVIATRASHTAVGSSPCRIISDSRRGL